LRRAAEQYAEHLVSTLGDQLVAVVLFGSVARGDAGAGSDVDLLIVARDLPAGQFARKRLLAPADAAFEADVAAAESGGVEVRLARIVRTPGEAARIIPLYLDMTEDAVVLVDRGGFFAVCSIGCGHRSGAPAPSVSGSARPGTGTSSPISFWATWSSCDQP
jgi:uncharacterized protein